MQHRFALRGARLALCAAAALGAGSPAGAQQWTHLSSTRGQLPAPTGSTEQTGCLTGDFDGDGNDDFVISSRGAGGKIELWRRIAGTWRRDPIEPTNVGPEAGGAVHDIDGDGDLDIVFGEDWNGNRIYWWENPSPAFGAAWTRRLIKNTGGAEHHDQAFGDVDGDGQVEFISWAQGDNSLLLFEIPANPRSAGTWPSTVVWNTGGLLAEGLTVGDVDGDGVDDIIAAGRWWRHVGGGNYAMEVVDSRMYFSRAAVGQLIPGGRPELVFIPGDVAGNGYFYEWNGSSWSQRLIDYFAHGHSLAVADLDRDGNLDIFAGEMKLGSVNCELRVYDGTGAGLFTKRVLSTGNGIHEGRLADVDGDGDLDIVHKPLDDGTPRVDLWMNNSSGGGGGRLDQWTMRGIDGSLPAIALFVLPGDLDGDGKVDVVAGDSWYRNPGSLSGTWTKRAIGGAFRSLAAVYDFDGDGDLDLLGTDQPPPNSSTTFVWAENAGNGTFTVRSNIQPAQGGDFLQGVVVARLAGVLQVALSWHSGGGGVQSLTVPASPSTQTWTWQRLSTVGQEEDVSAGDIDGDGDLDLMLGTVWLEAPSWQAHTIGTVTDLPGAPTPDRNDLADLDGDGDLDVVVGLENGREIVWFENPRPSGSVTGSWTRRIMGTVDGQGFSMDVGDIDRDGDIDVMVGEHRGSQANRVIVFENVGSPTNWPVHVADNQPASTIDHHDGTQLIDMDGDGDLDAVSTGWLVPKVWVLENRGGSGGGGQPLPAPVASPDGGTFRGVRHVALAVPGRPGASIHYTLDGSDPTQSSPRYTGPIRISGTAELKVKAFETGSQPSPVASSAFARLDSGAGHWRFDFGRGITAHDDSWAARDGWVDGATWRAGRLQVALEFNGTGNHVDVGGINVGGSTMTLSAWVFADRFDHLAGRDPVVLAKARGTTEQEAFWSLSTVEVTGQQRLRFRLKTNGSTTTLVAANTSLPTQTWVHVAASYDGSRMRLFQDGVEVGNVAKTGNIDQDASVQTWIADLPPVVGSRPFDGSIDEVRIFERALTALELRALAAEPALPGAFTFGRGSRACGEKTRIEPSSGTDPRELRDPFSICSHAAPPNTLGALLLSTRPFPNGWRLLGADLYLDPTGVFATPPVATDNWGSCRVDAALGGLQTGQALFAQFAWIGTGTCGAGTLVTSDALSISGL